MTFGWVTSCDKGYRGLCRVLSEGLRKFSKHPLFVQTVNWETREYKLTQRLDVKEPTISNLAAAKLRAVLDAPFDCLIWIDCDSIPNWHCDDLMDLCKRQNWPWPLFARHPHHPTVYPPIMEYFKCKPLCDYAQTSLMLFSPSAKALLKDKATELYGAMEQIGMGDHTAHEEHFLNAICWKYGCNRRIPFCGPKVYYYPVYVRGGHEIEPINIYGGNPTTWHVFHWGKDSMMAEAILEDIIARGRDFVTQDSRRAVKPWLV